jgi:hypothetical protein
MLGGTETEDKKEGLKRWQDSLGHSKARDYTKAAADKGTSVHLLAERYLNKEDLRLSEFSTESVNSFNALKLTLNKIKVVAQEISLYSDKLGIAGRCDCIGYFDGVPAIIDFKTAARNKTDKDILDYKIQVTFYGIACNEMYGTDIQQGVVLMSSGTGFPLIFKFDIKDYVKPLTERIALYYSRFL